MSGIHDDVDLGHTVAGWTGCVVVVCGCATIGAAMCGGSSLGVGLGIGVIVLGGLVTWALHLAGWGKPSGPRPPGQWDWRVKDPMTGHGDCLACRLAGRGRGDEPSPEGAPHASPEEAALSAVGQPLSSALS
ncbi:HGxxPAAW family protein [Microbispora hainanensis]|uniref:HGxxPAAW family protein n=1 Tax=Microbispora hainanensis TaxID=568844 RepID=UPI0033C1F575